MIYRTTKSVFAILLIIAGIIVTPMPIPLGIIMIIIGLTLLASVSPRVKDWIRNRRKQFPGFSNSLIKVQPRLPTMVRKLVEETDPHKISPTQKA